MDMEVINRYANYSTQTAGGSVKPAAKTPPAAGGADSKNESVSQYAKELAKLAPSVKFSVGSGFSTAKSGKTLTISPQILAKMQSDPAQEKETKDLIKGVETAYRIMDAYCKATGWRCDYKHSFIDENGKYRSVAHYTNEAGEKRSEEFRAHVKEQTDKLAANIKERAEQQKTKLEDLIEKRLNAAQEKAETASGAAAENRPERKPTAFEKMAEMLDEKLANSRDDDIFLYQTDLNLLLAAAEEIAGGDGAAKSAPSALGGNFDLQA